MAFTLSSYFTKDNYFPIFEICDFPYFYRHYLKNVSNKYIIMLERKNIQKKYGNVYNLKAIDFPFTQWVSLHS
jgi:hypothetical protein